MEIKLESPDTTDIQKQENALAIIAEQEIKDQTTYDKAAEAVRSVKALMKEVDSAFDDMIKKAHELHKTALSKKAVYADPLKDLEKKLKSKMTRWIAEQERIRAEEARKALEEQRRQEEELRAMGIADVQVEIQEVAKVETQGIGYQVKWSFEIEDETIIPRDYLMPNEKKIGDLVKALKDQTNIPGVKVVQSKIAVVR